MQAALGEGAAASLCWPVCPGTACLGHRATLEGVGAGVGCAELDERELTSAAPVCEEGSGQVAEDGNLHTLSSVL